MTGTPLVFILFAAVFSGHIFAVVHKLELIRAHGDFVHLDSDNANIPFHPFVNICNEGVWTIYSEPNYSNSGHVELLAINGEIGKCTVPEEAILKSARAIGVRRNNSIPSATFFSQENLGGEIIVTENGVTSLQFPILSFVAINLDFIEFFDADEYQGNSFCVDMWDITTDSYWAWEWLNTPWHGSLAKSARLGCRQKTNSQPITTNKESGSGN